MSIERVNLSLFTQTLDFNPVFFILIIRPSQKVGHKSGKRTYTRSSAGLQLD